MIMYLIYCELGMNELRSMDNSFLLKGVNTLSIGYILGVAVKLGN
jgi:hypothetical protein